MKRSLGAKIAIAAYWTAWLAMAVVFFSSCAYNSSGEKATAFIEIDAQTVNGIEIKKQVVPIKWEAKDCFLYFLYWSKYKNHDRRTPFSSNETNGFETRPDPNSIKAAGQLAGEAAKTFIIP